MDILPKDNERLKIILGFSYGFAVLFVYGTLALVIAIGHVSKDTSYGLEIVLAALGPLGGLFAGWAFRAAIDK